MGDNTRGTAFTQIISMRLCTECVYGQESESAEIGFLWGPKHEQFSNASLSALNLKKHFET